MGRLGLDGVALQYVGAAESKMSKSTDGAVQDETAMVEDLLELGDGFATLTRSQIGFAAVKDWKHHVPNEILAFRDPKIIPYSGREFFVRMRTIHSVYH